MPNFSWKTHHPGPWPVLNPCLKSLPLIFSQTILATGLATALATAPIALRRGVPCFWAPLSVGSTFSLGPWYNSWGMLNWTYLPPVVLQVETTCYFCCFGLMIGDLAAQEVCQPDDLWTGNYTYSILWAATSLDVQMPQQVNRNPKKLCTTFAGKKTSSSKKALIFMYRLDDLYWYVKRFLFSATESFKPRCPAIAAQGSPPGSWVIHVTPVIPAPGLPASQLPGVWKGSPPSPTMAGHDGLSQHPGFPKRHNFSCLCFPLAQAPGLAKPKSPRKHAFWKLENHEMLLPMIPGMNHGFRIRPIVAFLGSGDWWRSLL